MYHHCLWFKLLYILFWTLKNVKGLPLLDWAPPLVYFRGEQLKWVDEYALVEWRRRTFTRWNLNSMHRWVLIPWCNETWIQWNWLFRTTIIRWNRDSKNFLWTVLDVITVNRIWKIELINRTNKDGSSWWFV